MEEGDRPEFLSLTLFNVPKLISHFTLYYLLLHFTACPDCFCDVLSVNGGGDGVRFRIIEYIIMKVEHFLFGTLCRDDFMRHTHFIYAKLR